MLHRKLLIKNKTSVPHINNNSSLSKNLLSYFIPSEKQFVNLVGLDLLQTSFGSFNTHILANGPYPEMKAINTSLGGTGTFAMPYFPLTTFEPKGFSFAGWVKYTGGSQLIAYGSISTTARISVQHQPTYIRFVSNGASLDYTFTNPYNQWQHVAVSTANLGATKKIFVNGILVRSIAVAANVLSIATPYLTLFNTSGNSNTKNFGGSLSEFGIWNRQLDDGEVWKLYTNTHNLFVNMSNIKYYDPPVLSAQSPRFGKKIFSPFIKGIKEW